jgi:hypothetical protein
MKEYDIFVPLFYNDGTPIEPSKMRRLQQLLLKHFDGFTYFPQANEGVWKMGDVTFRDDIVVVRVVTHDTPSAREFMKRLKRNLKRSLNQEDILIIARTVETI